MPRPTDNRLDLEYALGYLRHAERIQLGMARDSRLRLETSFERGKVNRRLALLYMKEIETELVAAWRQKRAPAEWLESAREAVVAFLAASVADLDLIRNDDLSKERYWEIILRMQEVSARQVGERLQRQLAKALRVARHLRGRGRIS